MCAFISEKSKDLHLDFSKINSPISSLVAVPPDTSVPSTNTASVLPLGKVDDVYAVPIVTSYIPISLTGVDANTILSVLSCLFSFLNIIADSRVSEGMLLGAAYIPASPLVKFLSASIVSFTTTPPPTEPPTVNKPSAI